MPVCRFEALGRRTTAPVAVGFGALLGQIGDFADGLIHRIACGDYTGRIWLVFGRCSQRKIEARGPAESEIAQLVYCGGGLRLESNELTADRTGLVRRPLLGVAFRTLVDRFFLTDPF